MAVSATVGNDICTRRIHDWLFSQRYANEKDNSVIVIIVIIIIKVVAELAAIISRIEGGVSKIKTVPNRSCFIKE